MAERLGDGVWLLDVGWIRPLDTNCYLVDDGEVTLIDAGLWRNRPSLRSELVDAGYGPGDVDRVLLTHYDLDHTTGLRELRPGFDGPVYIGQRDFDLYSGAWDPPLLHHKGLFHRVARRLFPIPDEFEVRTVADGDVIGGFTAFHTPGHNPGHTVYVHGSGAAFVGDFLWRDGESVTVPVWADSYDVERIEDEVVRFAERAPPFDVLAMGHGRPFGSDGSAVLRQYAATL
jgi:glyoxylase-like metal-dependent hydrolase (beta-lactamase superfamily II)